MDKSEGSATVNEQFGPGSNELLDGIWENCRLSYKFASWYTISFWPALTNCSSRLHDSSPEHARASSFGPNGLPDPGMRREMPQVHHRCCVNRVWCRHLGQSQKPHQHGSTSSICSTSALEWVRGDRDIRNTTKLFTAVVFNQYHEFNTPSPVLGDLDPPARAGTLQRRRASS
jgi:hypothetical protein